jgi:cytochrome bd-type quinol oxidase subunit 2
MESSHPSNWRSALLTLIASRVTLVQLESQDAAKAGARRGLLLVAVLVCAFFTWALLLAGGIAAISQITAWPWHWIAIAASGAHLAAALLFARTARKPGPPVFPVTRTEFQRDREWIENFQKTRKSND